MAPAFVKLSLPPRQSWEISPPIRCALEGLVSKTWSSN
jgi:hypothetical protein